MSNRFRVGQILFIGSNKKNQIVPVQVTERVTRETIEGRKVVYSVLTPKQGQPIDLDRINGQVFTSLEEAKNKMIANAERASHDLLARAKQEIERMVQVSAQVAQKFPSVSLPSSDDELHFDITDEMMEEPVEESTKEKDPTPLENDDETMISVPGPDGQEIKAKVRSVTVGTK